MKSKKKQKSKISLKIRFARFRKQTIFALLSMFFCTMVLMGGILNLQTVAANGGRMPVLGTFDDGKTVIDTDEHFSFTDYSQVELPYLADIFYIKNIMYYSIGDAMIWIGFAGAVFTSFFNLYKLLRYKYGKNTYI